MIFSDTIIEKDQFFLRNLIKTAPAYDVWSNASSSYGMFGCNYEYPLEKNNLYYVRYTYKFSTTNQSPTWVQYYIQGGSSTISAARINNPTSGTEYTTSGVGRMSMTAGTLTNGTIYNGNSNAINGVTSQIKNLMFYDVTELFEVLRAANLATTEAALKTWCDNNLSYSPPYTNYNITNLVTNVNEKVYINDGTLTANYRYNPVTLPTATRANYILDGWYDSASGGNKIGNAGDSYTPTGSKQLYAHWQETSSTVTIKYVSDDRVDIEMHDSKPAIMKKNIFEVEKNSIYQLEKVPNDGYQFFITAVYQDGKTPNETNKYSIGWAR